MWKITCVFSFLSTFFFLLHLHHNKKKYFPITKVQQTDLLISKFSRFPMIPSHLWYAKTISSPLNKFHWKKIDSLSNQQIQACSMQIKFIKIEQTSPIHMDDWTNQQQSFTMMTPLSPAAMTISSCDRINCSYCNYDR